MPSRIAPSKVSRHIPEKMKGALHTPFEEFKVKSYDQLIGALEKSKPAGAVVEVSEMTDSHHSPCMQEMQAIVVQSIGPEGQPEHTYFMYQYCATCKSAVRIL